MDLYLAHASASKFNKFSVNNFRENCLDTDTRQFGVYFYYCIDLDILKSLSLNLKRFGLRFGNKKGYLYYCLTSDIVFDLNIIDVYKRLDYLTTTLLFNSINVIITESNYNEYFINNREIFYHFCKSAYKRLKDWQKVADILISFGYYGTYEGSDFGTIVLWNTDIIKINYIKEYENKR